MMTIKNRKEKNWESYPTKMQFKLERKPTNFKGWLIS